MPKYRIRKIAADELPLLRKISVETFRRAFEAQNDPEHFSTFLKSFYTPTKLLKEMNNPASRFYFIEANGIPAGYLKLNEGQAQTEYLLNNALEIERIYVLEQYQGRGLGADLMEFSISQAEEKGFDWIWLGVWEHNLRAIDFYHKFGFRKFSTHIFQVGDDPQTDILMRRNIT